MEADGSRPVPCRRGGGQGRLHASTLRYHGGNQISCVAVVRRTCPSAPRRSALAPSTPHVRDPLCALRRPIGTHCHRRVALLGTPDLLLSSCWVHPISLIGIESPTAHRTRAFYSDIGIDFIDNVSEYYVHLLQATGLLLCHLIEPQHRCPCVRFAVASPSPSSMHQQLCCAIPTVPSVYTRSSSC